MRLFRMVLVSVSMALPMTVAGQASSLTEGDRVIGFEPTMGVLQQEDSVRTVPQGRIPTFSPDGLFRFTTGRAFDDHDWEDSWTTVRRGDVEVRYQNDDDMRSFGDSFYLNDVAVSPGYPVTSLLIDSEGRVWASLHAVSIEANRWRTAWKVYSSTGEELFSLEAPSRETVHDAHGDQVVFVRAVRPATVEVAIRRLSRDRGDGVIW